MMFPFLYSCTKPEDKVVATEGDSDVNESAVFADEAETEAWESESGYETVHAAEDEPVAAVHALEGWGYINTKGEWVIEPQYLEVYPFVDNVATVKTWEGQWRLINKNNDEICEFEKGIEVIEPGNPIINPDPPLNRSGCTIFDGMILIGIDTNGDTVVTLGSDSFGYANTNGDIVIDPQYRQAGAFNDGLAPVDISGRDDLNNWWGYIDKTGNMVIVPQFDYAGVFSEGLAYVQTKEPGVSGCINTNGELVISSYDYVYPEGLFKNGLIPGRVGFEYGVIDKNGNGVCTVPGSYETRVMPYYSPIRDDNFRDGLFPLYDISLPYTDEGEWQQGFIDLQGDFAIPAQAGWKICQGFFDEMCCVYQGSGTFSSNNKYGYIDTTGNVVIPIQYSYATLFRYGFAIVGTGSFLESSFMIIDKNGGTIANLEGVTAALPFTK